MKTSNTQTMGNVTVGAVISIRIAAADERYDYRVEAVYRDETGCQNLQLVLVWGLTSCRWEVMWIEEDDLWQFWNPCDQCLYAGSSYSKGAESFRAEVASRKRFLLDTAERLAVFEH